MKKNRMMRLASLLLVCVLLTTSVISGTYAKYVTRATGSDSARVAKFGVEVQALSGIFNTSYAGEDTVTVLATEKVIAPGTTGEAVAFTITGSPEVDVRVTVTLGAYTRVTLPAGDYKDYTTATPDDVFTATKYQPVKWTLYKESTEVAGCDGVGLDKIEEYFNNTLSAEYDVEAGNFATINGTYKLVWEWDFNGHDQEDTALGQIAAGLITEPVGYEGDESFAFSITVEQID